MRLISLLAPLIFSGLAAAQSNSPPQGNSASQGSQPAGSQSGSASASPTPSPIVSVGTTTIVALTSGRMPVTITSTFNTTITPTPAQPTQNSPSGTTTSSSSSSTGPLPTAPGDVNGGGLDLAGGAPHPGEKSSDGRFGPNDDYISAAFALHANAALVLVAGLAGTLVVV